MPVPTSPIAHYGRTGGWKVETIRIELTTSCMPQATRETPEDPEDVLLHEFSALVRSVPLDAIEGV